MSSGRAKKNNEKKQKAIQPKEDENVENKHVNI